MQLTAEEKLMYAVMKEIYDSGIPVSFKGSMVLKACLTEAGYTEEIRHTVDIDANWISDDWPSMEQLTESLQKAVSRIGIKIVAYRPYRGGQSAGFEIRDEKSGNLLFTIDMDVNRPVSATKIYMIEGIQFRGVAPTQMIADKVFVVSTDKVFRRIKDVIDLYYLSKVFAFDKTRVLDVIAQNGRVLGNFEGFLSREDELRHSYEKFRFSGAVNKPAFGEVYSSVKEFLREILSV